MFATKHQTLKFRPHPTDFSIFKALPPHSIVKNKDHTIYENKKLPIGVQKNAKRKSICKSVGRSVREYFSTTTLHGLRYAGDTSISYGERLFWLCAVFCAVGCAGYFINSVFSRYNQDPVLVTINPTPSSLKTVPFPAVTICSTNQVKKSEAELILNSGTPEEKMLLDDHCDLNTSDANFSKDGVEWENYLKFLLQVPPSMSETLKVCFWGQKERECHSLFNNALTDDGLCFTFNTLPRNVIYKNPRTRAYLNLTFPPEVEDWSPEIGYPQNASLYALPWRSPGPGSHLGLTVVLDANRKSYYCSSVSSVGFKVLLHNPLESPEMGDFALLASPGLETRITITPRIYDAVPALRNVDINKRRCYFRDEKDLLFFRTYTKVNCMLECQSNQTLESCGCVPFYLPKNKFTKICGPTNEECVKRAKEKMEEAEEKSEQCNCLPACFKIAYEGSATSGQLSTEFKVKEAIIKHQVPNYFTTDMTVLHLYFVETEFTRYTKNVLYGFSNFLSDTGGLLGLFLGFSFLSVVEIVYHVSLKIACKSARSRINTRQANDKNNCKTISTRKNNQSKIANGNN